MTNSPLLRIIFYGKKSDVLKYGQTFIKLTGIVVLKKTNLYDYLT